MKRINDIAYANTDCREQTLDLYLPDSKSFPVFVYFHGGGLEAGSKEDNEIYGAYFAERGIAYASVNYRKYPYAAYPDFIKDAAAATAWVFGNIRNYGDCDKIYVGGSSAGAYLSMMLCFDNRYLSVHGLQPMQIAGFVHDAGQPTVHFNVLRERGIDTRRILVDEAAPLYHVGNAAEYPPMLFLVSDDDMPGRYEQTRLLTATLDSFKYADARYRLKQMHGPHVCYLYDRDESGTDTFSKMICDLILNGFVFDKLK